MTVIFRKIKSWKRPTKLAKVKDDKDISKFHINIDNINEEMKHEEFSFYNKSTNPRVII